MKTFKQDLQIHQNLGHGMFPIQTSLKVRII